MGNGVTPKAITHRIGKIRSLANSTSDGESPSTPAKPKASPKKPRAPRATKAGASASKAKTAGRGKGKKRGAATLADSEDEEAGEMTPDNDSAGSASKKVKLGEKIDSSNEEDEANDANGKTEI
ncbi:hypothetical protein MMC29_005618 [Sticta canariensis]|nr:hypothetical protein [Sticta canariensis]